MRPSVRVEKNLHPTPLPCRRDASLLVIKLFFFLKPVWEVMLYEGTKPNMRLCSRNRDTFHNIYIYFSKRISKCEINNNGMLRRSRCVQIFLYTHDFVALFLYISGGGGGFVRTQRSVNVKMFYVVFSFAVLGIRGAKINKYK